MVFSSGGGGSGGTIMNNNNNNLHRSSMASSSSSSWLLLLLSSTSTFTYLIGIAFGVSLFGLGANLMHLQNLTIHASSQDDVIAAAAAVYGYGMMPSSQQQVPYHLVQHRSLVDDQQSQFLLQQRYKSYRNSNAAGSFRGSATLRQTQDKYWTEEAIFTRLLKQSVASLEECTSSSEINSGSSSRGSGGTPSKSSLKQPQQRRQLLLVRQDDNKDNDETNIKVSPLPMTKKTTLPRFGFMNALNNHLSIPSLQPKCRISPPKTACTTSPSLSTGNSNAGVTGTIVTKQRTTAFDGYTMLVIVPAAYEKMDEQRRLLQFMTTSNSFGTSGTTTDLVSSFLRPLFLQLMSWIVIPEVVQIIVFLPTLYNTTSTTITNKRSSGTNSKTTNAQALSLLEGNEKYGQRLLSWHLDPTHKLTLVFTNSLWNVNYDAIVTQDSVVWMQASSSSSTAATTTKTQHVMNHRGLTVGWELWKRHADAMVASQGYSLTTSSSSMTTSPKTCIPDKDENKNDDLMFTPAASSPQYIWLDGVFHHSSFLCFLSQHHSLSSDNIGTSGRGGVLKQLYSYTTNNIPQEQWAISILLQQLSGQDVYMFPPKVSATATNNIFGAVSKDHTHEQVEASLMRKLQLHGRQQLQPSKDDNNFKIQETLSAGPPKLPLESSIMMTIAGFFGSIPKQSIAWCESTTTTSTSSNRNMYLACHEDVSIQDLPWMNESCQ